MLVLGFTFLVTIIAVTYAVFLRKAEVRRQEWRQESRATWTKN